MLHAILVFSGWLAMFIGLSILFMPLGILWFIMSVYTVLTIE